jgi:hypothetical protein
MISNWDIENPKHHFYPFLLSSIGTAKYQSYATNNRIRVYPHEEFDPENLNIGYKLVETLRDLFLPDNVWWKLIF